MNIFITGANGFIGLHVKNYLLTNNNFKIFAPSSKELNLTNESAVDAYIQDKKIDIIIHLANKGGDRNTLDIKNVVEYNLRIFFNIAKHENKVDKIISFGSGAEYSKHKPIIEAKEDDYLSCLPLDEYGFYKSITSRFIEKSSRMIQLRLFGVYGIGEDYRYKFISNAIVKNLLHLPITIHKNVFFDYLYIDDLIKIIDYFMHNNVHDKIYNVTKGEKIDLKSLSNLINKISDFESEIFILSEGLNNEYTSNNDRLKKEIKNIKFTPHKEAVLKMHSHYKNNLDKINIEEIKNDSYIKLIDKIWKGN